MCTTARHKIAQRGKHEQTTDGNTGNFQEFLHLVAKRDKSVAERLKSNRSKYTSPNIQNELLHVMVNMLREEISAEVSEAKCFSIMADEGKDIRKAEQLSIVVRYVYNDSIHEEFLGFVRAQELNAAALSSYILSELEQRNIDIAN